MSKNRKMKKPLSSTYLKICVRRSRKSILVVIRLFDVYRCHRQLVCVTDQVSLTVNCTIVESNKRKQSNINVIIIVVIEEKKRKKIRLNFIFSFLIKRLKKIYM